MPSEWGYAKTNGPSTWGSIAPAANGKRQSPIDIEPSQARFDKALKDRPLRMGYDPSKANDLINTGRSVQVTYDPAGSFLEGGPLSNKYQLAQFHFHWGQTSATGSEHTVDGHAYSAEAHLVHYNTDKYSNFGDAAKAGDGLCVLGIFLKPGATHAGFKQLTDLLSQIKYKDNKIPLKKGFDPACLLPADLERYWTYPGSLTTPPCFESVTWVVFREPIEVAEEQLETLRHLRDYTSDEDPTAGHCCGQGHIVENYRPPQPLKDRALQALRDLVGFEQGCNAPDDEFKGQIVENYRPPLDLQGRTPRASFQ